MVVAPIVLFTYANPMLRMGLRDLHRARSRRGVDGVLVLDLPVEEAAESRETLEAAGNGYGIPFEPDDDPTADQEGRASSDAAFCGISRLGVTGTREHVATGAEGWSPDSSGDHAAGRDRVRTLAPRACLKIGSLGRCRRGRQRPGVGDRRGDRPPERRRTGRGVRPVAERRDRECATGCGREDLRPDIDRIDELLVRLLNDRAASPCVIGAQKRAGPRGLSAAARKRGAGARSQPRVEGPLGADAMGDCSSGSSTRPAGSNGGLTETRQRLMKTLDGRPVDTGVIEHVLHGPSVDH